VTLASPTPERQRLRIVIRGAVQGVGFRPFVYGLARAFALAGWVNNSSQGVGIEVEGLRIDLKKFLHRLETEKPPHSFIQSLEVSWLDPVGYADFEIRASVPAGLRTALIMPDIATCPDCLREIFDHRNRRYRYPFTNCTHCGPRFSIVESLPYDRRNTSMKSFTMCPACQVEYGDPANRRFHAQPNACPVCGPQLELWDPDGEAIFGFDQALRAVARAVRRGRIVAVKGLGGFHLLTDARNEAAVRRLRERKQREEKPFALMFPTLMSVKAVCEVSPHEERLLLSPEAPIVLLRRLSLRTSHLSLSVAPGNPNLGVMLPSNPLHHLLMSELNFPVVATSGNLSDEPICTDEREAITRLRGIADLFLVHNRPIVRHVDDSIVRVMLDREMVLRRARGYAPLPIPVRSAECGTQNVLAVGAHLKSSIALAIGNQIFISQHIGDLETAAAHTAFRRVIADFEQFYEINPAVIASDLHPDYVSTRFARELIGEAGSVAHVGVQHHVAHVLSCMAENEISPPLLGVAWDGTGYGPDGTIWGGEFFHVTEGQAERVAHFRPFPLPGGDAAVKEPRRAALGLLYELWGEAAFKRNELLSLAAFSAAEVATLRTMLVRGLNSPKTSSVGRLFDAVAALAGLRQQMHFEGQAAMELEFALDEVKTDETYPMRIAECGMRNGGIVGTRASSALGSPHAALLLDWAPMIEAILADQERRVPVGRISAKFHNALAESIVEVAVRAGESRVALSGGCFQNRYLLERTVTRLRAEGFRPFWHQRVPASDGGIALGQVIAARWTGP
jgi:hydrogenase maturation protein HypF